MTAEEGWSSLARVAVQSVGCKLNQAETEWLARSFQEAGYRIVAPDQSADVYILNTCTVTHVADRKCRNLLRQARRRNPRGLIVATGCYAERAPDDLANLECEALAVGNAGKEKLIQMLGGMPRRPASCNAASPAQGHGTRSRAMVKIHEGCSQRCSFCIVPFVRGDERSRPTEDVITDVKVRVSEGCQEVVLTGTRIGRFHSDCDLGGLVERILAETEVSRLRLSSLEPNDLTSGLLRLWNDSRVCPHIHVPLQSGCDTVLERMGRPYSTGEYSRAVARARRWW